MGNDDKLAMTGFSVGLLTAVGIIYLGIRQKYGGVSYLDGDGFFFAVSLGGLALAGATGMLFAVAVHTAGQLFGAVGRGVASLKPTRPKCRKCGEKTKGPHCHRCGTPTAEFLTGTTANPRTRTAAEVIAAEHFQQQRAMYQQAR